jgi:protein ImuA
MRSPIITRLEREILPLQGIRPISGLNAHCGFEPLNAAFPNQQFPAGAVHEFLCNSTEQKVSSLGFMSGILSTFTNNNAIAWVGAARNLFPPALAQFGINPSQILFIHPRKQKDLLWTIEEVMKCEAITAVISEIPEFSFMASRRLQLAVETSGVTGFILRKEQKSMTTASVARWRITAAQSKIPGQLPGVGFPQWNVELVKVKNGKPGQWQLAWIDGKFELTDSTAQQTKKDQLLAKTG